jgi:uncharacterized protein YxeA
MLLHDDVLDTEFVAISDKAKNSLEAFKEKNQETFDNLEINDMFQDINETHELTESETVITYSSFKNENLFLKSTTNQLNEIISIEEIPKEDMPHNRELGNLDATLFFSNDLISYYDDLDNYLIDLEKLYNTYLTDELYEKITQIDVFTRKKNVRECTDSQSSGWRQYDASPSAKHGAGRRHHHSIK